MIITIKCLSLWQPWATLLVHGPKTIETRSWATKYRGPLLIHAAKSWTAQQRSLITQYHYSSLIKNPAALPFGQIIGGVKLVDCLEIKDRAYGGVPKGFTHLTEIERALGDYTPGRYAWQTADPVPFRKPLEYRGRQGLFTVQVDHSYLEEMCCAI